MKRIHIHFASDVPGGQEIISYCVVCCVCVCVCVYVCVRTVCVHECYIQQVYMI